VPSIDSSQTYAPTITTTYKLIVTDSMFTCFVMDSITIVVNPKPSVSVSTTNTPCGQLMGTATATVTGGTPPYSYLWNTGATTQSITGLKSGGYRVIVTDANGCTDTSSIALVQNSDMALNLVASSNSICQGDSVTITANATGGIRPYVYIWQGVPSIDSSQTYAPTITTTYKLIVTDSMFTCFVMDSITIVVNPKPSVSVSTTNTPCGQSQGTATAIVTGGTPPYNYLWNTGATTQSITGLKSSPNGYRVTVTDANGCTSEDIGFIFSSDININLTASANEICEGEMVTLTAVITGGRKPYTFIWDGLISFFPSYSFTPSYTKKIEVIVIDANGCLSQSSIVITVNPKPKISVMTEDPECGSSVGGTAAVSVQSGTPPFVYKWSNGATGSFVQNLIPGVYGVTVTDSKGCMDSVSVNINASGGPIVHIESTPKMICKGDSSLLEAVVQTGTGIPPYIYNWSPVLSSNSSVKVSPSHNTIYSVTVTDQSECIGVASYLLKVTDIKLSFQKIDENCNGSNGFALVNPVGGVEPYSYNWSNGSHSQSINSLVAGTYKVTVTDSNNCNAIDSITIGQTSNKLNVNITSSPEVLCKGQSADLTAIVTGGEPPYTYKWQPGGATTQKIHISPTSTMTYSVTVTDKNGCTGISQLKLIVNELKVSISTQPSYCGFANGSAKAIPSGGAGNYTYRWSTGATTQEITGLAPSAVEYSVTVTDQNGCTGSATARIFGVVMSSNVTASPDTICKGDSSTLQAIATGGNAPHFYTWSHGLGNGPIKKVAPPKSTTYKVTISDNSDCQIVDSVRVVVNDTMDISIIKNDAHCNQSDGSVSAQVHGGKSPYNYRWIPGGQTTALVTGLSAGTYTVVITDSNGCTSMKQAVIQNISGPKVNIVSSPEVLCKGQSADLTATASGGTAPYTYKWQPGGATTQKIHVSPMSTTTYSVTVTDKNGCTGISQLKLIVNELKVSISTQPSYCGFANGSAKAIPSGGAGNYTYRWNTGATTQEITGLAPNAVGYSVTVTDQNGCTGSATARIFGVVMSSNVTASPDTICKGDSSTLQAIATGGNAPHFYTWSHGLGNGPIKKVAPPKSTTYKVTISDNSDCQIVDSVRVVVNDTMDISIIKNDAHCNQSDGSVSAQVHGGKSPYNYRWIPGGQTTALVTGLSAGTYTVVITDSNGCTSMKQAVIQNISGPKVNIVSSPEVLCKGQSADLTATASGGTAPYTYKWQPGGATTQKIHVSPMSTTTYSVTVTDKNGCTGISQLKLIVNELKVSISKADATCGQTNGSATVQVIGGTNPSDYTYKWTGNKMGQTINNLPSGTYSVTVTEKSPPNCSAVKTVTINSLGGFATQTNNSAICKGDSTMLSVQATGGQSPYQYKWDHGLGTGKNKQVAPGVTTKYHVTVTDGMGCSVLDSVEVTVSEGPKIQLTKQDASCGQNNGSASVQIQSGSPLTPYDIKWSNGKTTQSITGLSSGVYSVTVTERSNVIPNCPSTGSIEIKSNPGLSLKFNKQDPSCDDNDGSAEVQVSGGKPPYQYKWNTGDMTAVVTGLRGGTYRVTVTDSEGCTGVGSVTLIGGPQLSLQADRTQICIGESTVLTAVVTGGSGKVEVQWDHGLGKGLVKKVSPQMTTTYHVTATDEKGCVSEDSIKINVGGPILQITKQDAECGQSNGSATVSVQNKKGNLFYQVQWSSGETDWTIKNKPPGVYTVKVTEGIAGCSSTATVVINGKGGPVIKVEATPSRICKGEQSNIVVQVLSGVGPFDIQWDHGLGKGEVKKVSPKKTTTYHVTVEDMEHCKTIGSVTVMVDSLELGITKQDAECGQTNGSATVQVIGGTNPSDYTYKWTGNKMGQTINNLPSGTYSVTVTEKSPPNCSAVKTVTINSLGGFATQTNNSAICKGDSTMLSVQATGGQSPYQYKWDHGLGTGKNKQVAPGVTTKYHVTVTDGMGCSVLDSVEVTVSEGPKIQLTKQDASCGQNNGSASVQIQSGSPLTPYDIKWSNGKTTQSITGLSSGVYSVTVTERSNVIPNCPSTGSIEVKDLKTMRITVIPRNTSCNANTGRVEVLVSGGTPPYKFFWSTGAITNAGSLTNLASGKYGVTVEDANGCKSIAKFEIQSDDGPNVSISANQTDICSGERIILVAAANGGKPGYKYQWDHQLPSKNTQIVSPTKTIKYHVTVTDANGCTALAEKQIDVSGPLTIGDYIWYDANYNGMQDNNESGINGVKVSLYDAGKNFISSTISSNNGIHDGYYSFKVCPGKYYLEFENINNFSWTKKDNTTDDLDSDVNPSNGQTDIFTVFSGMDNYDIDAGYVGIANLSLVKHVSDPQPNVGDIIGFEIIIRNNGPNDAEDIEVEDVLPNGYEMVNMISHNGILQGHKINWKHLMVKNGQSIVLTYKAKVKPTGKGVRYENIAEIISSSQFDPNSTPGNGADTDRDGKIGSADPDFDQDPDDEDDGDNAIVHPTPNDFARIGNFVWHDRNGNGLQEGNEPGIEGIKVILYRSTGVPIAVQTTDPTGKYLFTNLTEGDYYLEFQYPSKWNSTLANIGMDDFIDSDVDGSNGPYTTQTTHLDPGEIDETWDLGLYQCIEIGDFMWFDWNANGVQDPKENGLNGLEVKIIDAITMKTVDKMITREHPVKASNDGYYHFCVRPGSYFLKVKRPGQLAISAPFRGHSSDKDSDINHGNGLYTTYTFTVYSGDKRLDLDGGFHRKATVGNLVWFDQNFDGIQDAEEPPVEGVKVLAIDEENRIISETETDENGHFALDGLSQGSYYFKYIVPQSYTFTFAQASNDASMDSDVDGSNGYGTTAYLTLSQGEYEPDVDAGIIQSALAVKFKHFTGWFDGESTHLNWSVDGELNVDYYEVQRRGINEDVFHTISSVASNRNVLVNSEYSYIDFDLSEEGMYFYRIRQVSHSGEIALSEVVSILVRHDLSKFDFSVFPNPVKDKMKVSFNLKHDEKVKCSVVDLQGKVILDEVVPTNLTKGTHQFDVNVSSMAQGTYFIHLNVSGQEKLKMMTIIK